MTIVYRQDVTDREMGRAIHDFFTAFYENVGIQAAIDFPTAEWNELHKVASLLTHGYSWDFEDTKRVP